MPAEEPGTAGRYCCNFAAAGRAAGGVHGPHSDMYTAVGPLQPFQFALCVITQAGGFLRCFCQAGPVHFECGISYGVLIHKIYTPFHEVLNKHNRPKAITTRYYYYVCNSITDYLYWVRRSNYKLEAQQQQQQQQSRRVARTHGL